MAHSLCFKSLYAERLWLYKEETVQSSYSIGGHSAGCSYGGAGYSTSGGRDGGLYTGNVGSCTGAAYFGDGSYDGYSGCYSGCYGGVSVVLCGGHRTGLYERWMTGGVYDRKVKDKKGGGTDSKLLIDKKVVQEIVMENVVVCVTFRTLFNSLATLVDNISNYRLQIMVQCKDKCSTAIVQGELFNIYHNSNFNLFSSTTKPL